MKSPKQIIELLSKKSWWVSSAFKAMVIFGKAHCSSERIAEKMRDINEDSSHELWHVRQAQSCSNSWILFYLKYGFQWIGNLNLIFINTYAPYKFMNFELDAYSKQTDFKGCRVSEPDNDWKKFKKIKKKEFAKLWYNEYKKTSMSFTEFINEVMLSKN